jgi:hypothetical protein
MMPQVIDANIAVLRNTLDVLLKQAAVPYSDATPASFPEKKGIYIITSNEGVILRAGKTGSSRATLRQRLYQNHLMGSQSGNLPAQLVGSRQCTDLIGAKAWIRRSCSVRFLPIEDDVARARVEHFMLAVAQPQFCDNNKWD